MKRFFTIFSLGVIVSCYFFPFSLSFLPSAVNTKMMLAAVGVVCITNYWILVKQFICTKDLLWAGVFAMVFSVLCFISINYNYTDDYSYVTYFISFFTWLAGAYAVYSLLRAYHGKVTFKLLTFYLAGVCTAQCILALMIDRIPVFKSLVDTYIVQGHEFLDRVNRLYGIGASLDPAGTRFSVVLIMIAFLLFHDEEIRSNTKKMITLLSAFFIISIIGNMVARTTTAGMLIGLAYMMFSMHLFRAQLKKELINMWKILIGVIVVAVVVATYFYYRDPQIYELLRFAFEGFFSWVETGKWATDSTDKLQAVMWVWPTTLKGWTIGTGRFESFIYSTDIGYCRFILYCGLVGFSVFALFFVYNSYVLARKFYEYRLFFLALCALSFIIWLKVATDLFVVYALFYCLDDDTPLATVFDETEEILEE